jgi:hypothetical protein
MDQKDQEMADAPTAGNQPTTGQDAVSQTNEAPKKRTPLPTATPERLAREAAEAAVALGVPTPIYDAQFYDPAAWAKAIRWDGLAALKTYRGNRIFGMVKQHPNLDDLGGEAIIKWHCLQRVVSRSVCSVQL